MQIGIDIVVCYVYYIAAIQNLAKFCRFNTYVPFTTAIVIRWNGLSAATITFD